MTTTPQVEYARAVAIRQGARTTPGASATFSGVATVLNCTSNCWTCHGPLPAGTEVLHSAIVKAFAHRECGTEITQSRVRAEMIEVGVITPDTPLPQAPRNVVVKMDAAGWRAAADAILGGVGPRVAREMTQDTAYRYELRCALHGATKKADRK